MTAPTLSEVLFWAMHDEAVAHLTTCPRNDGPNGLCCVVGALLDEATDEAGLRMETVGGGAVNDIDYARIHLSVAIKVWKDSPRWVCLFPAYSHSTELLMDAASISYDLAVAELYAGRAPRGWWARQVPT